MSTNAIIIIAVVAVIALLLMARGSGPRVTHIDRTVRREREDEE